MITEKKIIKEARIFLGPKNNPFLAPRYAILVQGKLIVSDTGQNRVFIWNHLPDTSWAEPDVVLGQSDPIQTARNAGKDVDASTLLYPSGIWSDGHRLIVADAWNHRVLLWLDFPKQHGQKADVVIGQPDFNNNLPNVRGIGKAPAANTLNWPYGVFSDGQALWIADTGNRRVLFFRQIPNHSFAPADHVIGKDSFEERDYDHFHAIWPYSVKVSSNGHLAITDTQYYRVLIWNQWQNAFSNKADVIIGQPDFQSNGQNQFRLFPDAHTLSWCYDSCFYKNGIWVADTGNSRVLWFDKIPNTNNLPASRLIGQKNFHTGSENPDSIRTTDNSYYWPFSVCVENNYLVIADTGNHRIVLNQLNF